MDQGTLKDFRELKTIVLDEADRMLDMGFKEDLDCILNCVKKTQKKQPQFLLFSATKPPWVDKVAQSYLNKDYKMLDLTEGRTDQT